MSAIGVWIHGLSETLALRAERVLGYPGEKRKFYSRHGYRLNLSSPQSFNEKVVWKKLYDRNPLLPVAADKHAVRGYATKVLGENEAREILIPQLHVTDDPATIPFDSLPDDYIVKANHASGRNLVVRGRDKEPALIAAACREWLASGYARRKHEWAYQDIPRRIVIEELLRDESGNIPRDYKFHMFHGACALVQVDFERYGTHRRSLFDADWNLVPVSYVFPRGPWTEKPRQYDRMLQLAKKLSRDFDFVRVDLYEVGDRIYLGELTHYPGGGMEPFHPPDIDFEMGLAWHLEPGYWKKGR